MGGCFNVRKENEKPAAVMTKTWNAVENSRQFRKEIPILNPS